MFLTYEEYQSMGGALGEAAFSEKEQLAEAAINAFTHGRVRDEDPVRECVKRAACDLIALLVQEAENACNAAKGLSSESNDGVSVSYAGWTAVSGYWKARRRELLAAHLADETVIIGGETVPLLYGGVEYDGRHAE